MRRLLVLLIGIFISTTIMATAAKLPPTVTQEEAAKALQAAMSMVSVRYVWGGQSPSGFDCSGLVIWAYNQSVPGIQWRLGNSLETDATAHTLFLYNVYPVSKAEVWPGDLVFVTNSTERITHVGMFSRWLNKERTEFEWVEASSSKKGVVVSQWTLGKQNGSLVLVGVGRVVRWPIAPAETDG